MRANQCLFSRINNALDCYVTENAKTFEAGDYLIGPCRNGGFSVGNITSVRGQNVYCHLRYIHEPEVSAEAVERALRTASLTTAREWVNVDVESTPIQRNQPTHIVRAIKPHIKPSHEDCVMIAKSM